ncbi:MAG UNVERIFIED_CONTAM: hypothetical protein LVR29_20960 [Microcystis novacekii LVE1205-3]|jgi:hypothetical protein
MSLIVEQLIYSSFSELGFKYIAGANVPLGIQEVFYQHIVSQLWDNYNPPDGNFKGVYIHQIDSHNTLFGWLINDGKDEFGRGDIPYFHCYYLQELLDSKQLVKILACLETGPLKRISRDAAKISLDTVVLAENYQANAFELGIKLSKIFVCLVNGNCGKKNHCNGLSLRKKPKNDNSPPIITMITLKIAFPQGTKLPGRNCQNPGRLSRKTARYRGNHACFSPGSTFD